jgi:hypothetical protein
MSLISLLDEKTALVDLPWLTVETVELLKSHGYTFIEIDASERETLACNVMSLGNRRLVAIEENRKTNRRLRDAGFEVHTFPGSEICVNGAGGPTCLTRPLLRSDSQAQLKKLLTAGFARRCKVRKVTTGNPIRSNVCLVLTVFYPAPSRPFLHAHRS